MRFSSNLRGVGVTEGLCRLHLKPMWITGMFRTFQRCSWSFRGVQESQESEGFQEVPEAFQGCSWGFQKPPMSFERDFRPIHVDSEAFQGCCRGFRGFKKRPKGGLILWISGAFPGSPVNLMGFRKRSMGFYRRLQSFQRASGAFMCCFLIFINEIFNRISV